MKIDAPSNGRFGKPTIRYDGYTGIQRLPGLWQVNDTNAYIALTEEAYNNYNAQFGLTPDDDNYLRLHDDLQPGSRHRNITTDWIGDVLNQNAPITNHNLSVSGASEDVNYFVSGSYFGQAATIENYDLDRFSFRVNSDFRVNDWLRFGETFSVTHQEVRRGMNAGGDGFLLRNAATMPPFFEIYENEHNRVPGNRYRFAGNSGVAGMISVGNQNAINRLLDNRDRASRLLGGLHAEVDVLPSLTYRSQGSVDLQYDRDGHWQPAYSLQEVGLDRPRSNFNDARFESTSLTWTNTLSFNNSFGAHNLNVLGGTEVQRSRSTGLSTSGRDFLSDDPRFHRVVRNSGGGHAVGGGGGESAFLGYLGRLSYNYADRYLLTASVRRDGTSQFSPENNRRWGTFPSVSAGWRVSEEAFFRVPFISELKLRGSWGQLGNSATASYPHIFRVSTTPDYGLGGRSVQAPVPSYFVNRDVIWETVETVDGGFELGLLDDQLIFGLTLYRRTTKDFLVEIPIPNITGFANAAYGDQARAPLNAGSVLNRGVELEANYATRLTAGIGLNISGNLTTVRNRLTALTEGVEQFTQFGAYRTAVGFPIGYFYGYKTCGIYQTPAAAAAAPEDRTTNRRPVAGDLCFQDLSGPDGAADGLITPDDRTYLGKTIPDFYYGLNIGSTFRRFDLSLLFQGVHGVELYNEFRAAAEWLGGGGRNQLATTQNRWRGEGSSNTMPRAVANDPNGNNRFSDRWVEDGSFLRLRNVQLGYTLPDRLFRGVASNARVYLSATNLLTLTGYSGLDPEVRTVGQWAHLNQLGAGTDQGNVPQPRTFQIGWSMGL